MGYVTSVELFMDLKPQRIKELKKLRQHLACSSFAYKSSWIMLTSLDLY